MLMRLYKDAQPQDYTFEDVLNNPKLKRSINTKIYRKVKILKEYGMEWEDIESEINIALFKSYKTYDGSSSVFSTYALHIIENEMKKLLNHVSRQKRDMIMEKEFDSFDRELDVHDDSSMTLECVVGNKKPLPEDILLAKEFKSFINSQNEYTRDLMYYMIGYKTIDNIVSKYGYSKMYHYNKINNLKIKLKYKLTITDYIPITSYKTTKVKLIKNGKTIGIFNSLNEAKNISEKAFNIKLYNISAYQMLSKFVG